MKQKKWTKILFLISMLIVFTANLVFAAGVKKKVPVDNPKTRVNVYIRVEGYNHTIIPRTKVSVGVFDLNPYKGKASGSSATASKGWAASKFKRPTVAHAIVKILQQKGIKYDLQDYGWSLYFAMINNEREFDVLSTSGWMYRVNGNMPPIGSQAYSLKGGEDIVWYFGAAGFNTIFTELKADKIKVKKGTNINLTLSGRKDELSSGRSTKSLVSKAQIYVNGKPYKLNGKNVITNSNGKAVVKFSKPGTYRITAERFKKIRGKSIKDIVRPVPVTIKVVK